MLSITGGCTARCLWLTITLVFRKHYRESSASRLRFRLDPVEWTKKYISWTVLRTKSRRGGLVAGVIAVIVVVCYRYIIVYYNTAHLPRARRRPRARCSHWRDRNVVGRTGVTRVISRPAGGSWCNYYNTITITILIFRAGILMIRHGFFWRYVLSSFLENVFWL